MRGRSYRRLQKQRIHRKWYKIGARWGLKDDGIPFSFSDESGFEEWVARTAENMPVCSNPHCCGNPRKLGHRTRQETKAKEDEIDQTK